MSFSFMFASPVNTRAHELYSRYQAFWKRLQPDGRLPDDPLRQIGRATVVIFGMGRVGSGAFRRVNEVTDETVIGVDFNPDVVARHREEGRFVIHGDPTDADFWDRLHQNSKVRLVMLAMSNFEANRYALQQVKERGFGGQVVATARYPDEVGALVEAGANAVFSVYAEVGVGFADLAV